MYDAFITDLYHLHGTAVLVHAVFYYLSFGKRNVHESKLERQ